jgi:hypothetical protein
VDQEQTPKERALELVRLLVPSWGPTTTQFLWAVRIAIVLGVLITIGYAYGITLWDWIKLLIVPAVIAGGGLWFNAQQREREQRIANQRAQDERRRDEVRRKAGNQDELRKNLLERLDRTYSDFKRAKRLLRARAFAPPYYDKSDPEATVNLEQYDELLGLLNDAQLEMEQIGRDVRAVPMLFDNWEEIAAAIRDMETSLNRIVREYETERGKYDGKNPPKISDLPRLADVVGTSAEAKSLVQISNRYREAARYMQQRIAEPYD